jgi:di-N-acetylchitobiase
VNQTFTDGLNIDIESPILANDTATRENLDLLLLETVQLFREFLPNSQISFDVAWSPDCIDER